MSDLEDALDRAQRHLVAGRFPEAKAAVDEAFAISPSDDRVRGQYETVYLAHGIRLSGVARERRRAEIERRGRPGEVGRESDDVRNVFRDVLLAFDRVLAVNPTHAKALALKAQVLFRIDRENREQALALYAMATQAIEATVPEGPARETGRRNLLRDRRRIEAPCRWCDDTGFCPECGGSGWRTVLGFRKKCEACLGHGTCKRCGVL